MPLTRSHLYAHSDAYRAPRRTLKIALAGGVRQFPADSHWTEWQRQAREFAMLGSLKRLRIVYGIGLAVIVVPLLIAYVPSLRELLWSALTWAPLVIAALVALGLIFNILFAILSMYIGYRPADAPVDKNSANVSPDRQKAA